MHLRNDENEHIMIGAKETLLLAIKLSSSLSDSRGLSSPQRNLKKIPKIFLGLSASGSKKSSLIGESYVSEESKILNNELPQLFQEIRKYENESLPLTYDVTLI